MHSPPAALAWQLYRPYRPWLAAGVAYFLAVFVFCRVTPETTIFAVAGLYLASPLVIGMLLLLTVFAYGSGFDLASTESGFPSRMFALPVPSRALVGWPMFCGTVAIGLASAAIVQLLLRPNCARWMEVPLWWPAFFGAGFLAWFQALSWSPFALAWLRLVAAVPVFGLLIALPILGNMYDVPETVIVLAIAVQFPVAYAVAVAGVSRARRGDTSDWRWPSRRAGKLADGSPRRRERTFASAARAQAWFEWRLNGLSLPVGVSVMLPVCGTIVLVNSANPDLSSRSPLGSLLAPFFLPLLMGCSFSAALSRFGGGRDGQVLSSFLATRPLDSAGLVLAKYKVAVKSVLITYAVVWAAVALLLLFGGNYAKFAHWWSLLANRYSPVGAGAIVLLAAVGLMAGTWTVAAGTMCYALTGRKWVVAPLAVVVPFIFFGMLFLGFWLQTHPEYLAALWAASPWLLGAMAALKLLLAGWLLRVLSKRRLWRPTTIKRLVGLWSALAAGLLALLYWLAPAGLVPWYYAVSGVVLGLPMVGIELAPLAVAWNRHR